MVRKIIANTININKSMKFKIFYNIAKVLRYVRLYGLKRTLIKIKGKKHCVRTYSNNPPIRRNKYSKKSVAIIGCGNYSYSNIAFYLRKNYGNVIRASMDIDINKAISLWEEYNLDYYTTDYEEILSDSKITLIYIATNHSTHAEYAIKALQSGKNVYIEKPHVTSYEQLNELCLAKSNTDAKIVGIGFNRPYSHFGKMIKNILNDKNKSSTINWYVVGHYLERDHWYYKDNEGGRVLGNLCHWIDFVYNMIPDEKVFPIKITPTVSDRPDTDIVVTYVFGNGTLASLTFSAKGKTFEGVRENLCAQIDDKIIVMNDFQALRVDMDNKKILKKLFHRDHGHEAAIKSGYDMTYITTEKELSIDYIWGIGYVILKTRDALVQNKMLILEQNDSPFYSPENIND